MKNLILSTFAGAAICMGAGSALADAECQAGSAWGYKPGCGGPTVGGQDVNVWSPLPQSQQQAQAQGWSTAPQQPYAYGQRPRYDGYPSMANAPSHYPYVAPTLNPTRRDRDGDGVQNRHDRRPDDPSRW